MLSLIIQYKGDNKNITTRIDKVNLRQSKSTGAGLSSLTSDIVSAGAVASALISATSIWASGNSQTKISQFLSLGASLAAGALNDTVSRRIRKSINNIDLKIQTVETDEMFRNTEDLLTLIYERSLDNPNIENVFALLSGEESSQAFIQEELNVQKKTKGLKGKKVKRAAAGAGASIGIGLGLQVAQSFIAAGANNAARQRDQKNQQFRARLNGVSTTGAF